MAALMSSVVYHQDSYTPVLDSQRYENCVLVPPLRPNYENYTYSVSSNVNIPQSRGSNRNITPVEFECLPVLPESASPNHKTLNKNPRRYLATPNSYDNNNNTDSCSEIAKDSNKKSEADKKAAKSGQSLLRRSLRLSKKSMGSGAEKETFSKKKNKKRNSNKTMSVDSNDNGGFDSASPKPVLGVKDKLRFSLDKINLKSPFRWSSSDKLTHYATKANQSKKNSRRYSDSNTFFLATDKNGEAKKSSTSSNKTNEKATVKSVVGLSRMVRAYPAVCSDSFGNEVVSGFKPNPSSDPNYVNLSEDTQPLKIHTQTSRDTSQTNRHELYSQQHGNDKPPPRSVNIYHDLSTSSRVHGLENNNTATRAKGTWKMLKPNKNNKHPNETQAENLQAEDLEDYMYASEVGEIMSMEPPKLAPVSGKLLPTKSFEKTILKPTAYRPPPISNQNSPFISCFTNHSPWQQQAASEISASQEFSGSDKIERTSFNESNNSDSGRLSVTSIPATVNVVGSFSCSGSEGYASARISSSTNHSAVHDHETSIVDSCIVSPRKLSDDETSLTNPILTKPNRTEFFRNDSKGMKKVVEETGRSNDSEGLKLMSPGQMKLQRRSSTQEREQVEKHFRRLHEEQKQLHDANNQLEERIKSMTEAIDAQSRRDDGDVTTLHARLEEGEVEIQQQRGEISVLKRQVVENRNKLSQRSHELLALKSYNRDLASQLAQHEADNQSLVEQVNEQRLHITDLERCLTTASQRAFLATDSRGLPTSQSAYEFSTFDQPQNLSSRFSSHGNAYNTEGQAAFVNRFQSPVDGFYSQEKETLSRQLHAAEQKLALKEKEFDRERQQWAEDKRKVIKYQKLLQENYVQMYKRSHALERQVKSLTSQLHDAGLSVNYRASPSGSDLEERSKLCYPMEI